MPWLFIFNRSLGLPWPSAQIMALRFSLLGHNLAMAGALCAAHLIGEQTSRDIYWHAHGWRPNTDGKAAPGVS